MGRVVVEPPEAFRAEETQVHVVPVGVELTADASPNDSQLFAVLVVKDTLVIRCCASVMEEGLIGPIDSAVAAPLEVRCLKKELQKVVQLREQRRPYFYICNNNQGRNFRTKFPTVKAQEYQ